MTVEDAERHEWCEVMIEQLEEGLTQHPWDDRDKTMIQNAVDSLAVVSDRYAQEEAQA